MNTDSQRKVLKMYHLRISFSQKKCRVAKPGFMGKPSFFKVMIGDYMNKMQIPPAFLKHFNGILPRTCRIWSPIGRSWHVKMLVVGRSLFFNQGWRAFCQDHSLELGEFLLFKYNGNSEFHVKVYERTACEKEFSMSTTKTSDRRIVVGKSDGKRVAFPAEDDLTDDDVPTPNIPRKTDPWNEVGSSKVVLKTCTLPEFEGLDIAHEEDAQRKVAEAHRRGKPYNYSNTSFMVTMKPSYVGHKAYVAVPHEYASEHFTEQCGEVVLMVSDGSAARKWYMKYSTKHNKPRLYFGWINFVQENCLEEGDTCVFEAVDGNPKALKVGIHRRESCRLLTY